MRGKYKCRILKAIRKRIADDNEIPYEIRDCNYHGECSGTCPKCDEELRWLEEQLRKRKALGYPVRLGPQDFNVPAERIDAPEDDFRDRLLMGVLSIDRKEEINMDYGMDYEAYLISKKSDSEIENMRTFLRNLAVAVLGPEEIPSRS